MNADIIVVGAGAAGLWAAERAARAGRKVLLLEKTPRAGTKILASGGTRCNLTTTLDAKGAARLFGDAELFLLPALKGMSPQRVRRRFHDLGVETVEEPHLEKVFPASQRAVDVRDALLEAALKAGVEIRYNQPVLGIAPGWTVTTPGGEFTAPKLLLCSGGQSYPRTGTTGDAYSWLRDLGLAVTPPVPALVPLASGAEWVRELSGISVQQTEARLLGPSGKLVQRRARPVLFTHHGLSGPGAMDLSARVARDRHDGRSGHVVTLDLLPSWPEENLRAELLSAAGRPGGPRLGKVLTGEPIPARLLAAVLRQAGIADENPALHSLEAKLRNKLADALKALRVPISGTLGWDQAEVTAGGLSLDEVERETYEVKRHPGLYVFGELLDLTGPIGGLNFQAAFSTAERAAVHAAR